MITFYIKLEKMFGTVLARCIEMVIMCDPQNQAWSLILTTMFLFHLYIQSVLWDFSPNISFC